jgi:putative ABC transport system permease protein
LRVFAIRLAGLFRRRREADLSDEIECHLQMLVDERVRRGIDAVEARRQACVEFGSVEAAREQYHDQRTLPWIETLLRDARIGARALCKLPLVSGAAVLILALAVGGSTAIFSVVDTVLLRPLPYHDAARLLTAWQTLPSKNLPQMPVSDADYADYRAAARSLDGLAALYIDKENYAVTGLGDAEQVSGMAVTPNIFPLLGVAPVLGRTLRSGSDAAGRADEVVVSFGFWQRRLGGERSALGRALTIDGQPFTIVGVMPPGFECPPPLNLATATIEGGRDLWLPLVLDGTRRDYHPLAVVARLAPGATLAQARAEASTIAARLASTYPATNAGVGMTLVPMIDMVVRRARPALFVFSAGIGCLLLIACLNVAHLLLARSTSRRRELAVRVALGAGRYDLLRQVTIENALLAILGGVLGLGLAAWALELVRGLAVSGVPRLAELRLDWRVVVVGTSLSLGTCLLVGLAPSLAALRIDVVASLKEASRAVTPDHHGPLRRLLVVGEISIALVLLVTAGLLMRSFARLSSVDLGFQPKNALTAEIRLLPIRYADDDQIAGFETRLLERLRRLPGVLSAATVNSLPIVGFQAATLFRAEGQSAPQQLAQDQMASLRVISPGYFRAMGTLLVAGREFDERDAREAPRVVVISEALARRTFGGDDPIGRRIQLDDPKEPWLAIVGVARDVRQYGLAENAGLAVYVPYLQDTWSVMSVVVRTAGQPEALAAAVREQVRAIDPQQPLARISTLDQIVAGSVSDRQFQLWVLAAFAGVALLLALVGIYAVVSYSVAQRAREIAVRMALGAGGSEIARGVLRQGLQLGLAGILLGLVAAAAASRAIESLLFQIQPFDPITYSAVALLVLGTTLAASYFPAQRASRASPVVALRE